MKRCIDCKRLRQLKFFHKEKHIKSGYRNQCRDCRNIRVTLNQRKNYDPVKEHVNYLKRKLSGKSAESNKRSRKRWPQKFKARELLQAKVRSGVILRLPCEKCGKRKTQAHHPDYSRPLDVRWLCVKHHGEVHRKLVVLIKHHDRN